MKTFIALAAGFLVFLLMMVAISITQALIGFQPAHLGPAIGTAYTWLCALGSFLAARWAFRKICPAKPKKPSGPLSGAGKSLP